MDAIEPYGMANSESSPTMRGPRVNTHKGTAPKLKKKTFQKLVRAKLGPTSFQSSGRRLKLARGLPKATIVETKVIMMERSREPP